MRSMRSTEGDSEMSMDRTMGNVGTDVADGIILRINVKNFFCHDHLEVKFNRNVNFVVGRNGSGKSAVLTALVVGLGGRASATNRGASLKSFVKTGRPSATVEIELKNSSPIAHRPEVYGDTITVVRTITALGASSYKVKAASGRVVSTRREEIDAVCSALDIQVDNPICVLNQDDARNFHASDPAKKYSLYRRATNMELIQSNYNKALNACVRTRAIVERRIQEFEKLNDERNRLMQQCQELQASEQFYILRDKLQEEIYWREIVELEKELKLHQKQCEKQTGKIQKIIEHQKSFQDSRDNFTEAKRKYENEIAQSVASLEKINSDARDALTAFQELKTTWKSHSQQIQRKKEQIDREESNVNALSREVGTATNENSSNRKESLESEKSAINQQLEEAISRKNLITHELDQLRSAHIQNNNEKETIQQNSNRLNNSINHFKSQINELNARGGDDLLIYGSNMVDLVKAMKRAYAQGQFSAMPRGPIGSFLKVRDKSWTGALEHIIGLSIQNFCVNNDNDSRKLFEIMKSVYKQAPKPAITTSKFFERVHDVSGNDVQAPRGYRSALNCLQVADPVVANYLIDNLRMESILLVPTDDEAIEFCTNPAKIPARMNKIVTLDSSEFYPKPNFRSYGGAGRRSRFLQVNTQERKMQLESELKKVEAELASNKNNLVDLNKREQSIKSQDESLEKRLRTLLNGIRHHNEKINNIDLQLQNLEGGHLKVLMVELNNAKEKLEALQTENQQMAQKEVELRKSVKEAESKYSSLKEKKQADESELIKLQEELKEKQLTADQSTSEINVANKAIVGEKLILEKHKKSLSEVETLVNEKISKALVLGPRIEEPKPLDVLEAKIKKIEKQIESVNKGKMSKVKLMSLLEEKTIQFETMKNKLDKISNLVNTFETSAQQHQKIALAIMSMMASRVTFCFQSILQLRQYSGSMKIDDNAEALKIHCTGRDSADVRVADSTGSLSGGERSYATVAFIMALWECMELPFYFLDEFDVFMDNVNRKITMELLINHAAQNRHRQYVFLTPQDTSTLEAGEHVGLHRLADPVRRET